MSESVNVEAMTECPDLQSRKNMFRAQVEEVTVLLNVEEQLYEQAFHFPLKRNRFCILTCDRSNKVLLDYQQLMDGQRENEDSGLQAKAGYEELPRRRDARGVSYKKFLAAPAILSSSTLTYGYQRDITKDRLCEYHWDRLDASRRYRAKGKSHRQGSCPMPFGSRRFKTCSRDLTRHRRSHTSRKQLEKMTLHDMPWHARSSKLRSVSMTEHRRQHRSHGIKDLVGRYKVFTTS